MNKLQKLQYYDFTYSKKNNPSVEKEILKDYVKNEIEYKEYAGNENDGTISLYVYEAELTDIDKAQIYFRFLEINSKYELVISEMDINKKKKVLRKYSMADYVNHCQKARNDPCNLIQYMEYKENDYDLKLKARKMLRSVELQKLLTSEVNQIDRCSVLEFEINQIKVQISFMVCTLDMEAQAAFRKIFIQNQFNVI